MIIENIPCKIKNQDNGKFLKAGERMLKDIGCGTAATITARYYKGIESNNANAVIVAMRGSIECDIGGVADLSFPDSKTRRGRVQEGGQISPTLTAAGSTEIYKIETAYRIRKLTPRECGRLMDVSDDDITKMTEVNSNSQLYKQFGNSIVKRCMVAMFSNLNIQGLPRWDA